MVAPTNRRSYGFDWEDWGGSNPHWRCWLSPRNSLGLIRGGHFSPAIQWAGTAPGSSAPPTRIYSPPSRQCRLGQPVLLRRRPAPGSATQRRTEHIQRAASSETPSLSSRTLLRAASMSCMATRTTTCRWIRGERCEKSWLRSIAISPTTNGRGPGTGGATNAWIGHRSSSSSNGISCPGRTRCQIDFATASPGVSAWCDWVGIEEQVKPFAVSKISATLDADKKKLTAKTENVARLALKLATWGGSLPQTITVDGTAVELSSVRCSPPIAASR